jgi:hypothetical protein
MLRNFRCLNMTDIEKYEVSSHVEKIWFLNMTEVEKSEISPHLACVCLGECLHNVPFMLYCCKVIFFFLRFSYFCVEKSWTKHCVYMWKNDKYEVCKETLIKLPSFSFNISNLFGTPVFDLCRRLNPKLPPWEKSLESTMHNNWSIQNHICEISYE